MAYIGVSPSNGVRKKHTYTATASQTSFSGAGDEGITLAYRDSNYVDVYQNGVKLADEDYTATSGTAIVLAQGASADDIVEIIAFDVFSVADTVSKADGGTFDGNITAAGTLGVTGVLTANGGAVFNEASADVDFRVESDTVTHALFVDGATGKVGIGTSVPDVQLHLSSADGSSIIRIERNDTAIVANDIYGAIEFEGQDGSSGASGVRAKIQAIAEAGVSGETGLQFFTAGGGGTASERMRLNSSGDVAINTNLTPSASSAGSRFLTVAGSTDGILQLTRNGSGGGALASANGAGMIFYTHTGTVGSETYTERMRIEAGGDVLIRKTSGDDTIAGTAITSRINQTTNGDPCLLLNRGTDDGTLVILRQNNVSEGTISVSGTTVSYNGGHLSRWSQLTNNTRDNTIVKGTVMTNLDQMAEWTTDGVTEDNEQLNCMAVSSVEGDANVAGVFVNWDNDDDIYTNDMNIAMTGDMVIRIAQGTTVARGDLLISAGDGTAKTQDDDIVRSKTIAKVTSTIVSHTYDDGTYLVPCVLMAC